MPGQYGHANLMCRLMCVRTQSSGLVCVFVICVPHFYPVYVPALCKHMVGNVLWGLYIK